MILMYPKIKLMPDTLSYSGMIAAVAYASGICYNVDTSTRPIQELEDYVGKRLAAKHESILEHVSLSVEFTIDRGVSHELVRHRLCAFTQSSTRYCDYAGDREDNQCRFIIPPWSVATPGLYDVENPPAWWDESDYVDRAWFQAMEQAQRFYHLLRGGGWRPEQARSVLPNSLMTKILVTANIREWQHILSLRALGTTGKPHPQMREVMVPLLLKFAQLYPIFFQPMLDQYNAKSVHGEERLDYYRTEVL